MPQVYWDEEQTDILHVDLDGVTTWEIYHRVVDQLFAEVKAAQQPAYVILHARKDRPPGSPLPHFRARIREAYTIPNLLLAVTVDQHHPAFFARMVNVVIEIYFWNQVNKVPYVTSEVEAYAIIAAHRQQRGRSS